MSASPNPLTVLLADDDEYRPMFYKPYIDAAAPGAKFLSATNASDAKALIAEHKPDILLLDVTLPVSEYDVSIPLGQEYLHSVQVAQAARKEHPQCQIILISTYANIHKDHYPTGTTGINSLDFDSALEPAVLDALQEMKRQAEAAATLSNALHASRIEQVRRSPWHNGSKEGCKDAWAIRAAPSDDDKVPER